MKWKVFYTDGSTYSSNDGTWDSAPTDGVQVVMKYFDTLDGQGRPTREIIAGNDYYCMHDDDIHGCNEGEPMEGTPKNGELTTEENYMSILETSLNDYNI